MSIFDPSMPSATIQNQLTSVFTTQQSNQFGTQRYALLFKPGSYRLNLIFTPGIYHVNQTINVTKANTVILGLGFATIIPDSGVVPMQVADVDGVKIAGLLFDAGQTTSPVLLQVGPTGASASHAANPTSIQDVFFRIGGAGPGSATTSLVVNNNDTIIDHTWAWRADHGAGVGWTVNPADTGLIVNGANVMAYGLFEDDRAAAGPTAWVGRCSVVDRLTCHGAAPWLCQRAHQRGLLRAPTGRRVSRMELSVLLDTHVLL